MRKVLIIALSSAALAACSTADLPRQGLSAVNVPVVSTTNFVFDAAAPGGALAPGEAARLDSWFRTLDVRYGDTVFVDGFDGGLARAQVAEVAGNYGLLVTPGAPVTVGQVVPETVRVVVSRNVASVPNCPNWSGVSQPNLQNQSPTNFGCSVNSALAAQIANPQDLIHGQEGNGVSDARTASRGVNLYRTTPPSGTKGLQDVNTKGGN
jgi:pilus assembly protein CpaD